MAAYTSTTPTGARTLPAAEFDGVTAFDVRVRPRWHGSHWATGRDAPITRYVHKALPAPLPLDVVRKRAMYGY